MSNEGNPLASDPTWPVRFEERQIEVLADLAKLVEKVSRLEKDLTSLMAEVGGAPIGELRGPRETIRDRLHTLENDKAAATAAHAALEAARATQAAAWTRAQKVVVGLGAGLAAISSLLRLFGVEI